MITKTVLLDEIAIERVSMRIAHEIIEKNKGCSNVTLVGIKSKGVPFAQKIARKIEQIENIKVETCQVDISHYRDDLVLSDSDKIDKIKNSPLNAQNAKESFSSTQNESFSSSQNDSFSSSQNDGLVLNVQGKNIVLCDDVICTGRTARCAIEAVIKLGRPKTIQLAILIDRGHRELPIRADYVGKNVPTSLSESILVNFKEIDSVQNVTIVAQEK